MNGHLQVRKPKGKKDRGQQRAAPYLVSSFSKIMSIIIERVFYVDPDWKCSGATWFKTVIRRRRWICIERA